MASITTIKDSTIRVKASIDLINLLQKYNNDLYDMPENIRKSLETPIPISSNVETVNHRTSNKNQGVDLKLLKELLKINPSGNSLKNKESNKSTKKIEHAKSSKNMHLYLSDIHWLSTFLARLRKDKGVDIYLNDILEKCQLELPQNEIIKRNPELEARCQKLREEQQNLEYRKMTKNVDAVLKHYPEDTVAYQIKAINSQIIAVLQFIFSVAAGFAFGFLGINLIIGNMEFGLRLLLGVMCALIIALAEIYFLAKKLNEYDNTVDTANKILNRNLPSTKKYHAD